MNLRRTLTIMSLSVFQNSGWTNLRCNLKIVSLAVFQNLCEVRVLKIQAEAAEAAKKAETRVMVIQADVAEANKKAETLAKAIKVMATVAAGVLNKETEKAAGGPPFECEEKKEEDNRPPYPH